jgi:hypothetical protein
VAVPSEALSGTPNWSDAVCPVLVAVAREAARVEP